MTGPFDPNHDLPEPLPAVLPVWDGMRGHSFNPVLQEIGQAEVVRVALPFGWGLAIDPELGAVVRHAVRADLPSLGPAGVIDSARQGFYGFRLA